MKQFNDKNFVLDTEIAQDLYHNHAAKMPIIDYHCHLIPEMVANDHRFKSITELWLGGDHYKWRAMRSCGVEERCITGDASDYEKFCAFARVMPYLIGNPIYHWTHLELQRYFDIRETLSEKTAKAIWDAANAKISAGGFSPRALIARSDVVCVCTTDDPADTLEYHALLKKETDFPCKVLPAFRPDKALGIEQPTFPAWLASLERIAGEPVGSFASLKAALRERIRFFDEMGCRASDQAFSYVPFETADEIELELIFSKALHGEALTVREADQYRTALLQFLAAEYASRDWVMELHIGPMRNNNTLMFNHLGPDAGFDSVDPALHRFVGQTGIALTTLRAVHAQSPRQLCHRVHARQFPDVGSRRQNAVRLRMVVQRSHRRDARTDARACQPRLSRHVRRHGHGLALVPVLSAA